MQPYYVIYSIPEDAYYAGTNLTDMPIAERHFEDIWSAMELDTEEEALGYIKQCHMMSGLTIIKCYRAT